MNGPSMIIARASNAYQSTQILETVVAWALATAQAPIVAPNSGASAPTTTKMDSGRKRPKSAVVLSQTRAIIARPTSTILAVASSAATAGLFPLATFAEKIVIHPDAKIKL